MKSSLPESVLLVANYPSDVGYAWWLMENFWCIIAADAQAAGRNAVLAYPKVSSLPLQIRSAPISVIELNVRRPRFRDRVALLRLIRSKNVRSVYLTDWPALSISYLLWRLIGVRSIVLHDHTPGDRPRVDGWKGWLKRRIHLWGWLSCDAYVGVSGYIRQRLIDNWRVPEQRAFVVHNGIRPFDCDRDMRASVRADLGVADDELLVVLVSRATIYKGWDFAIRCAAKLGSRGTAVPRFRFVFCGDGPALNDFRGQAARDGVAESTLFLGKRDDIRSIICSADLAFHPSRGEAMSLAVLEFMSAGLPVVVPDRPSVSGAVTHGVTGLIYRAEDLESAVDALARLASDPNARATMGANARQVLLRRHQLSRTNEEFRATVIPLLLA